MSMLNVNNIANLFFELNYVIPEFDFNYVRNFTGLKKHGCIFKRLYKCTFL